MPTGCVLPVERLERLVAKLRGLIGIRIEGGQCVGIEGGAFLHPLVNQVLPNLKATAGSARVRGIRGHGQPGVV